MRTLSISVSVILSIPASVFATNCISESLSIDQTTDPATYSVSGAIYCNVWTGSGDWMAGSNWLDNPNYSPLSTLLGSFGPFPRESIGTFMGPLRDIPGPQIVFPLHIDSGGPAVLAAHFDTPSLEMRAGSSTILTLNTGALLTTSATVGTTSTSPQTQAGWKAVVNFNGGQIAGSWTFTDHSEINILKDFTQPSSGWSGTPKKFSVATGVEFNLSGNLQIQNIVNNAGSIKVTGGATTGSSSVYLIDDTTLQGGGQLVLTDQNYSQINGSVGKVLTNVDHTIRGKGYITRPVINQNIIRAEGGQLTLYRVGGFDNSEGLLQIAADGVLSLPDSPAAPLGDLEIESGGMVANNSYLNDVKLLGPGDLTIPTGSLNFKGTIDNPGGIVIGGSSTVGTANIYLIDDTTLQGGGELLLTDQNYSRINGSAGKVLTNVDHTIRGKGYITRPLANQHIVRAEDARLTLSGSFTQSGSGVTDIRSELSCSSYAPGAGSLIGSGKLIGNAILANMLVSPGNSLGALTIEGTTSMAPSTRHRVEFGGVTSNGGPTLFHDVLVLHGNATIGGILDIRTADSVPGGTAFTIVTTRSLAATSSFSHNHPVSGLPVTHPLVTGNSTGVISGTYLNVSAEGRVNTSNGLGSFLVTVNQDSVVLSDYQLNATPYITQELAMSDEDKDGVVYILEWIFGSDPAVPDATRLIHSTSSLQGATLAGHTGGARVFSNEEFRVFSFRVRKDRPLISLASQVCFDLSFPAPSTLVAIPMGAVPDGLDFEILSFVIADAVSESAPPNGFIRIAVDISQLPAF